MVFHEETELRLGLPGNNGTTPTELREAARKRGFSETQNETITTVNLMLNLSSNSNQGSDPNDNNPKTSPDGETLLPSDIAKTPAKAQVVGWPPVRSFRKNMFAVQKSSGGEEREKSNRPNANANASFVKVSMDGAPYLRKVDVKIYNSYQQLSDALGKMFSSFTIGNCESQGMKDIMNESKLMDLLNSSDYVPTYKDRDGDWMLVGDVPWEGFVQSCKRLRIMIGKEAIGLAPKAMEKCKNRSY